MADIKPGSKLAKLFEWIKREMVGSELVFTSDHAEQLVATIPLTRRETAWQMLKQLDNKKLLTRKKRKGEKGIIITLINAKSEAPVRKAKSAEATGAKPEISVREVLAKLREDVERLIEDKGYIENQIRVKNALIEQITEIVNRR